VRTAAVEEQRIAARVLECVGASEASGKFYTVGILEALCAQSKNLHCNCVVLSKRARPYHLRSHSEHNQVRSNYKGFWRRQTTALRRRRAEHVLFDHSGSILHQKPAGALMLRTPSFASRQLRLKLLVVCCHMVCCDRVCNCSQWNKIVI
jgi:hypothetical protein